MVDDGARLAERPSGPATLADVAARAQVSRQTVSNALNKPSLLRADTLERVLAAISDLGYTPNRAARNLRTRASHLIGLRLSPVVETSASGTMERFVHALVRASRGAGYQLLLFDGPDPGDPASGFAELVRSNAVDAFVVTDTFLGSAQAAYLEEVGMPFVAFGRPWQPAALHPWVDVDGRTGTAAATEHLIRRGHEVIAWIGWREASTIGEDRRTGWSRALARHGLSAGSSARVDDTAEDAHAAAGRLLDADSPTAFVCASDTLAVGVLAALAERGLRPGTDVAVIGFDDSPLAHLLPGGLTSVRPPLEQVAEHLVEHLGQLLTSPAPFGAGTLLEPTLVVRGSA